MKKSGLALLFLTIFIQNCKKSEKANQPEPPMPGAVIENTILQQILPQLQALAEASTNLEWRIAQFNQSGTDDALRSAQQSWLETRLIWEQYEAALYGPVTTLSIDPALDSWPVNFVEIDAILASGKAITGSYIDSLPETLRGFHCIEYILFGNGKSRQANQINSRMKDMMLAMAENLKTKTHRLLNEWSPAIYNYADQFLMAGKGSTIYKTKQEAMLEIAGGLSHIVDEVANDKIQEPFVALDSMLEESPFALNSWTDFKHNIIGVSRIYEGKGQENSLSTWVQFYNKSLDGRIKTQVNLIIQSINAFGEPFGRSIHVSPGAVTSLQIQLNQLHDMLDREIIPLIRLQVTE